MIPMYDAIKRSIVDRGEWESTMLPVETLNRREWITGGDKKFCRCNIGWGNPKKNSGKKCNRSRTKSRTQPRSGDVKPSRPATDIEAEIVG